MACGKGGKKSGGMDKTLYKEKGAKALTWWRGVRVCVEQTESKRRASLIH